MKQCTKCGQTRQLDHFTKDARTRDGLTVWCKSCRKNSVAEWRLKNPEKKREYDREWYQKTKPTQKANPVYRRSVRYKTPAKMQQVMLVQQEGRCAICDAELDLGKGKTVHLDHCHETDLVRGWLCRSCNQGLGKFRDDPTTLLRAALYLVYMGKKWETADG
jgi:hypothetical protein